MPLPRSPQKWKTVIATLKISARQRKRPCWNGKVGHQRAVACRHLTHIHQVCPLTAAKFEFKYPIIGEVAD